MNWFKRLRGNKSEEATELDFATLMARGQTELQLKTQAHQGMWRFGEEEEWGFDQHVGLLQFTFADGRRAEAPAQIIGTYNSADGTWMWAWNNPSIADPLKRDSLRLKAYGQRHRIAKLTTPKWSGDEKDAWAMAGLALTLCEAQGAYRGPAGTTYVFFTFGEVRLSQQQAG